MSNFNPNGQPVQQGALPGQSVAPVQNQQVGPVGAPLSILGGLPEPQTSQVPAQPEQPQVQIQGEIDPTRFDLTETNLSQVLPQEVINHLHQWQQQVMQHHVTQAQRSLQQQNAQLQQQLRQVQDNYAQYVSQVQPEYADQLERARLERDYQAQLQAQQQKAQLGQKAEVLQQIAQRHGLRIDDLWEANNPYEAQQIAADLVAARSRIPNVPQNQMQSAGPSGGYPQAPAQMPVAGSPAWHNMWAMIKGEPPPYRDAAAVEEARRALGSIRF